MLIKKMLNKILICSTVCSYSLLSGLSPIQQDMIDDLNVAKYNIHLKYAPSKWKEQHLGWDLEEAYEIAKQQIISSDLSSSKDYHRIFSEFLASMKDYHVSPQFYSTERAIFPLKVEKIKNRYFITEIGSGIKLSQEEELFASTIADTRMLEKGIKQMQVGDEIIAFDEIPIHEYIDQLIASDLFNDFSPTGYAIATKKLFVRLGRSGNTVPEGFFELTLKRSSSKNTFKVTLPWICVSEWVYEKVLRSLVPNTAKRVMENHKTQAAPINCIEEACQKDFIVLQAKDLQQTYSHLIKVSGNDKSLDKREKSQLPPIGKIIWESSKSQNVYAYIFINDSDQKIGYVHVPTFYFVGQEGDVMMEELYKIFKVFNKHTSGVVIDITNNIGGNMIFMYAVLSILANKPLKTCSHQEIIIQEDVYKMATMYNELKDIDFKTAQFTSISGYIFDKTLVNQLMNYANSIMSTWQKGERLTDHLHILGIDKITPNSKVRYKKPVVVLTNELCFSCADFFPAIIQDNKRGTVFGAKTAGAGGYVKRYPHLSRFGLKSYSLTASIGYRLDGSTLENLGVTPDVPYELTVNDIKNNYSGYIKALNEHLKKVITK